MRCREDLMTAIARKISRITNARIELESELQELQVMGSSEDIYALESLIEQLSDLEAPGGAANYFK